MSIFKDNIFDGKVAFVTGGGSGNHAPGSSGVFRSRADARDADRFICRPRTFPPLAIHRHLSAESLNQIFLTISLCTTFVPLKPTLTPHTAYRLLHGANATILGRRLDVITSSAQALSAKTGRKCLGISGDVRSPESLKEAVEATLREFGKIDFVICGAAGNFLSPIEGMSENAFQTVMSIDTLGTYNTIKATVEEVKKTKGSYIATSATLHYKGTFMQAHVSAAKAAIDALFRVAAVEFGPFGVRFNIIAPGPIGETEGVARLLPAETKQAVIRAIPMQRLGELADIANAGVYLFSSAASYITGSVLVVDGGEYHTSGVGYHQLYPNMVLNGGDFRKLLASKL
ncbi:hypothetical protein P7C70_g4456, partial [Phenoliferia sp. Uapishka_3]